MLKSRLQTVQIEQTVQTVQTVQTALCWLENFDCYISPDTDKFILAIVLDRHPIFTVLCSYFQPGRKLRFLACEILIYTSADVKWK